MFKIKQTNFDNFLQAIKQHGYQLAGPTIQNRVIVYDRLETNELPEVLNLHFEHPKWHEIVRRCLSCTNCTSELK
jgi:hypothetical protein